MKRFSLSALTIIIATLQVFSQQAKIEFTAPLVYPEGVAYNPKNNTFYVSSVTTGTIGAVDATGKYTVFFKDSTMKSSFGMKVDEQKERLWVCTGDPNYSKFSDSSTFKKISKVIALDCKTGKKLKEVDLSRLYSGKHFANDLTMDDHGNLYITDSFSPVIYKVDQNGKATVLVTHDLFKSKDVGLNGIVYHPDGFLLTVNNGAGTMLKIDLKNNLKVSKIKIDQFFPGADGLLLDQDEHLILVQNKGINKVFKLSTSDKWSSAKILSNTTPEDRLHHPTTATSVKNSIFVLNSKMNELQDSTKNPSPAYSLQKVNFDSQM